MELMFFNYCYREIKIYLKAARLDHWFKNIFMLIGAIGGIAYSKVPIGETVVFHTAVAFLLTCLISSVNYIVNEIVDARYDKVHPNKKLRPVASGIISTEKLVYLVTILLFISLSISYIAFNGEFFLLMILFFVTGGIFYNIPPIRTKDLPYFDIISESVNNPIRLLLGWNAVNSPSDIPLIAIVSYWSLGAALVTAKRWAELRFLGEKSVHFRPTFGYYSGSSLTLMYFFYMVTTIVTFILLSVKYKNQLLYFTPFVLIFFIWLTFLTIQKNSVIKEPERIFEKKGFVLYCLLSFLVLTGTLFL